MTHPAYSWEKTGSVVFKEDKGYEWSPNEFGSYQSVIPGDETGIYGLSVGTVYVRYKETGHSEAGPAVPVMIGADQNTGYITLDGASGASASLSLEYAEVKEDGTAVYKPVAEKKSIELKTGSLMRTLTAASADPSSAKAELTDLHTAEAAKDSETPTLQGTLVITALKPGATSVSVTAGEKTKTIPVTVTRIPTYAAGLTLALTEVKTDKNLYKETEDFARFGYTASAGTLRLKNLELQSSQRKSLKRHRLTVVS